MMEGVYRDWVICCGTYNSYEVEEMGLVQGHAYTIVYFYVFSWEFSIDLESQLKSVILGVRDNGKVVHQIKTKISGTQYLLQTRKDQVTKTNKMVFSSCFGNNLLNIFNLLTSVKYRTKLTITMKKSLIPKLLLSILLFLAKEGKPQLP